MTIANYSIQGVFEKIKHLLIDELSINLYEIIRDNKHIIEIHIKSHHNTWTHQRRKRRQKHRLDDMEIDHTISSVPIENKQEISPKDTKRKRDDDDYGNNDDGDDNQVDKRIKDFTIKTIKDEEKFLLHCSLSLKKESKVIILDMQPLEKSINAETTFQLFQYFKNKLI